MSQLGITSKCSLVAGAAMLLSFAAAPIHAQGVPPGSYLRSCTHVGTHGDTLTADCRRTDGSWGRTALRDVGRCVGDIGNMDGQLACMVARGDLARRGIATTASRQNTAIAMTATAGLATVLRAGIRRQAAIPTDTADSQPTALAGIPRCAGPPPAPRPTPRTST